MVTARRDPDGLAILPPRHYIVIPATLRYRCGLLPGDPVLVAARPAEGTLTAYSLAVVDQALAAQIPFPAREMTLTGPDVRSGAPGQAVVDAALLVLERMGLTPADLLAAPAARPPTPTFAVYIPVVSALVGDGCRRAYGSYWNRVVEQ